MKTALKVQINSAQWQRLGYKQTFMTWRTETPSKILTCTFNAQVITMKL